MQHRSRWGGTFLALVAWSVSAAAPTVHAQQIDQWPNAPQPDTGRQVVPFMEGWYDNGDGTHTISMGYLNRNPDEVIEIPLGEHNYIDPPRYDGVQPTTFLGSRNRGMFAITVPDSELSEDIWWYITMPNGETYKVPGRTSANAYQLDWMPRPHGSLPPLMWFDSESDAAKGPGGVWADDAIQARVGQPVTIEVHVNDVSERDPNDPRFAEPIPVHVVFSKYQGPPGEVTFTRHPSSPEPEPGFRGSMPGPEEVTLDGVSGTARVNATFEAPGEYIIFAKSDNFGAPDSADGDQCCWTNAYQRVVVSQ